jgi:hypothetical protein
MEKYGFMLDLPIEVEDLNSVAWKCWTGRNKYFKNSS